MKPCRSSDSATNVQAAARKAWLRAFRAGALIVALTLGLTACDAGFRNPGLDPGPSAGTVTGNSAVLSDESAAEMSPTSRGCTLSAGDEAMLKLVNEARAEPRHCGSEAFDAAPPLAWSCELMTAARQHSQDMAGNNFFSHSGSDGLQVGNRVTATGYDWQTVGENIAAGYSSEAEAVTALLKSPGHCANIMNPAFRDFGAAVEFANREVYPSYWTQVFAAKSP